MFDLSYPFGIAVKVVGFIVRAYIWVLVTLWKGVVAILSGVAFLPRLPAYFRSTRRCARGHAVPMYGVYECQTCRGYHEGWAFGKCSVCGETAGWTPCPQCGLPVKHPRRW